MARPSRAYSGPWLVEETVDAFRITDAVGTLLSEIKFGAGSGSGLSQAQAKAMAMKMVQSGRALAQEGDAIRASRDTEDARAHDMESRRAEDAPTK